MYKNVIVHPHGFVVLQGTRNKNVISPHLKTKELDSISCWHTRPRIYFTINITRYFWFHIASYRYTENIVMLYIFSEVVVRGWNSSFPPLRAGTQKLFHSKLWEQFTYDHQVILIIRTKLISDCRKCPHSRKWWILQTTTNTIAYIWLLGYM